MAANLPEWSKGEDLRSFKRKLAWVRTPQLATFLLSATLLLSSSLVDADVGVFTTDFVDLNGRV